MMIDVIQVLCFHYFAYYVVRLSFFMDCFLLKGVLSINRPQHILCLNEAGSLIATESLLRLPSSSDGRVTGRRMASTGSGLRKSDLVSC